MTAEGYKGTLEVEVAMGLLQDTAVTQTSRNVAVTQTSRNVTQNLGQGIQKVPGSTDLSSQQSYHSRSVCFHGPSSINLFWISVPDIIHF